MKHKFKLTRLWVASLLLLFGVSQPTWAAESYTFNKGTTIYIDFSDINATDANLPKASGDVPNLDYKTGLGGQIITITFTVNATWWTDQTFIKTSQGDWTDLKFSKPTTGCNTAKLASDGKSYSWVTSEHFTPNEVIYFDASGSNYWKGAPFNTKFNWIWDSGNETQSSTGPVAKNTDCGTDAWIYVTKVPNNNYLGFIQLERLNPNGGAQWNYTNNACVMDKGSNNCLYCKSENADWQNTWVPGWKTYVPPMKSLSIANNGTTTVSGSGSQSDPYIIAAGATIKVKATAALQVDDSNPTFKYKYKVDGVEGSYGDKNSTYQFTAGNEGHTYAVTVRAYATYNSKDNTAMNASNTIYYKIPSYTITYKDQDGAAFSGDNAGDLPSTHTYGTATTLVNASRAGYRFDGWFENSDCTGTAVTTIGATDKTADFTLYAKWTEDKVYYTVSSGVKSYAGSVEQTAKATLSITATSGEYDGVNNKVLASSVLQFDVLGIATGYEIEGWYSDAACSSRIADTETAASYTAPAATGNISVYVKLIATQYSITYTETHSVAHSNPATYNVEDEITFFAPTGPRTGYTFTAWSPASIAKGTTGAKTVTANWQAKTYTISFNQNGGEGGQTADVTATYDQAMPALATPFSAPVKNGYKFLGYEYNGTLYYGANGTSVRNWNVDNNVTLTAKWDQIHVYIEGKFRVRATKDAQDWVTPGSSASDDQTESKKVEMPFDSENNKYTLNTWAYVDELAAKVNSADLKFHIATWTTTDGFTQLKASADGDNFWFNKDHKSATMNGSANLWFQSNTNDDFSGPVILTYDPTKNTLSYTAEPEPTFGINFKSGGHGHLNVSDGIHNVGIRSGYNITAYPDAGYKFEKWTSTGDVVIAEASNASTSITVTGAGTVIANFVEMKKIYYRKPSDWPNNQVFVYFYTTDKLQWNDEEECSTKKGPESKNLTGFEMTRIGKTDIYYYAYDFTAHAAVAFVNDRQDDYGAFDNTYVTALENFNPCYPLFNADNYMSAIYNKHGCNTENYKECKYYGNGYWSSYDEETEYYLRGSFNGWAGPRDEYRFKNTNDPDIKEAIWISSSENQKISFKLWQTCDCWLGKTGADYTGDVENISLGYGAGGEYDISYTAPKVGRYQFKYNVSSQKLSITFMGDIMVQDFPAEVSVITDRQYKITPTVTLLYGMTLDDLEISVTGNSHAHFTQSGTNLIVLGNSEGTDNVTVTYRNNKNDYSVTKTLKVNVATGITLQAKTENTETSWIKTDLVHVHFWSTDGDKAQDASMTYNSESSIYSVTIPKIMDGEGNVNFIIWYGENINMLGSDNAKWRQTDNMKTKVEMCYTIGYNSADNQYRIATSEGNLCESGAYQIEVSMKNGNTYLSNIVTSKSESKTFSFFAPKDGDETYKGGTVRLLMDGGVVKTLTGFSQAGVYVADLNGNDITTPELYNGDYYVIAGVSGSELNDDTKMHKFTPRANTAEDYSYYWTVYSGNCTDKNVIAKVANEYNSNLSLTIGADALTQSDGTVAAGNVRFSYEPTTNAFKRAILGASNSNDFLNVYGNNVYANADATQPLTEDQSLDLSKFTDNSDWVYEKVVYVKVESVESESKVTLKSVFNGQTSHLLGYEIDDQTGEEKKDQPKQLTVLGQGSTTGNEAYAIRISYDFKKNRLISSWEPTEGEYKSDMSINSDILFIRTEDGNVQQVQVATKSETESYKISSLQHVMFVMEIDGSTDQTSYSQYWISLPFDCQISDIFGVEGYITLDENRIAQKGTWGIMRYRGDLRAQKGWFKETDGFWEWMYENETMYAGEGYVLFFERSSIPAKDWPTIKDKEGVEKALKRLYFPSKEAGFVMSNTVDAEHSQFECQSMRCTIKTPEDREAYDSNWRVIGPKSYNNINAQSIQTDETGYGGQTSFPSFLYTYDTSKEKGQKYVAHNGTDFNYQSFHSYMVQYEGTITWMPYTQTTPATIAARNVENSDFKGGTLTIELMQNDEQLDRTFVKLDEKGTTGFDFSQDMTKITESCAQIASVSEDVLYAGNTLPLNTELVPLNVKVTANGTYDIALKKSLEGLEVNLFDAFEQTTTPLDLMSATVTLNKGEYKDRFYLQLKQKGSETPTSFDGKIEQYNLPTDKTQKLLINGNIYLINGGRVYNATGVQLR